MTLAALEATLRLALDPELASRRIPLWAFLNTPVDTLRARADRLADILRSELSLNATVAETTAFLGAGSVPLEPIPSAAVRVAAPFPGSGATAGSWSRALRTGDPPVVTRVHGGAVLIDLRAVEASDDELLLSAVRCRASPVILKPEAQAADLSGPLTTPVDVPGRARPGAG